MLKLTDDLRKQIEILIKSLGDNDWSRRDSAGKRLVEIDPVTIPFLEHAKRHSDLEIRLRAKGVLVLVDIPEISLKPEPQRIEIIDNIVTLLHKRYQRIIQNDSTRQDFLTVCEHLSKRDKSSSVRKLAVNVLREASYFSDIPSLMKALKDTDVDANVRVNAIIALNKMDIPKIETHLINTFDDGEIIIRETIIKILKNSESPEIIRFFGQALGDDNKGIRIRASEYVSNLSKDQINSDLEIGDLIVALKDEEVEVRIKIVGALLMAENPKTSEALNDNNIWVRVLAISALRYIRDPKAVEPLIKALEDRIDIVQLNAILTLGVIGDPRAVEPLIPFLQHENVKFRERAVYALARIGDPKAVIPLIDILENTDENARVRALSAAALGRMNAYRAIESLIKALDDEKEDVCKYVLMSLIKITGKDFKNDPDNKSSALWKGWWKQNKDYLYWCEKTKHFVVDEEAKKAGIPTEEYRKTHPWPKEQESDRPSELKDR